MGNEGNFLGEFMGMNLPESMVRARVSDSSITVLIDFLNENNIRYSDIVFGNIPNVEGENAFLQPVSAHLAGDSITYCKFYIYNSGGDVIEQRYMSANQEQKIKLVSVSESVVTLSFPSILFIKDTLISSSNPNYADTILITNGSIQAPIID